MFRLVFREPKPGWLPRLEAFEYKDRVNGVSRATFTVDNSDYAFLDFSGWAKSFTFSFGEYGVMSLWQCADLTKVTGSKELKVEAQSLETRLLAKHNKRYFEDTTLRDVVEAVAREWGLNTEIDTTCQGVAVKALSQVNETDAAFLKRQAQSHGYNFWIDGDTLVFRGETRGDLVELPFGSLIEEPTFDLNFRQLRKKGRAEGSKNTIGETDESTVGSLKDMLADLLGGDETAPEQIGKYSPATGKAGSGVGIKVLSEDYSYRVTSLERRVNELMLAGYSRDDAWAVAGAEAGGGGQGPAPAPDEHPARTKAEAARWLNKQVLKLEAKIAGYARVRAGDSIELTSAPAVISGQWFIKEAVHSWGGDGYTTRLSLTKHGTKKKIDKDSKRLEGAQDRSNKVSSYAGEVTKALFRDANTSVDPQLYAETTSWDRPLKVVSEAGEWWAR